MTSSPPTRQTSTGKKARGPMELPRRAWRNVLKRTFSEFREDNVTD
jgi:hypothetical protein